MSEKNCLSCGYCYLKSVGVSQIYCCLQDVYFTGPKQSCPYDAYKPVEETEPAEWRLS